MRFEAASTGVWARVARSAVTVALAVAVVAVAVPATAAADTSPTPTPLATAAGATTATTSPTPDPLASALDEAATVAEQVAAVQKAYAAATANLTAVQSKLSSAVRASGLAQDALYARTADAERAAQDAQRAASLSAESERWLRQQAALLYQGAPSDSLLAAVFGPRGPQDLSDMQVGMAAVLARNDNALVRARALASDAQRLSDRADDARAHQAEVAEAAKQARAAIAAVVAEAQAETTKIAAEQQALLDRLAKLRADAAALEQQREDELAALAGVPAGTPDAASLAKLYASGGGADLTEAQLHPQVVAKAILDKAGYAADQWPCLDKLFTAESGWNWAASNPTSGAYGIPQALPGSKMATAGDDWLVNPATQIRWGLSYVVSRYGSPCDAWSTWLSRSPHWY